MTILYNNRYANVTSKIICSVKLLIRLSSKDKCNYLKFYIKKFKTDGNKVKN
jgi:hypothetical protein